MLSYLPPSINPKSVGKKLAKLSREQDVEIKKIEDSQYGSVNVYHVGVWRQFLARQAPSGEAAKSDIGAGLTVIVNINGMPILKNKAS